MCGRQHAARIPKNLPTRPKKISLYKYDEFV